MHTPEPPPPLVPEIGILGFVPDSWRDLRQPRHQVLFRLARYFPVVWVEPVQHWREVLRAGSNGAGRGGAGASGVNSAGRRVVPAGLTIFDPGLRYPRFNRPAPIASLVSKARWRAARRTLVGRGCESVVLYLWRPEFAPVLDALPHDASCYHLDDEYSFSEEELPTGERESRLITAVDQVYAHSPALMEKKGGINPRTRRVPNGVDFEAFSTPVPEPDDIAAIPHPRIGYTGYLKKQLDWPLLRDLARSHLEWSFVFVGARSRHPEIDPFIEEMATWSHVHFLGAKPSAELAGYPQHFDVCMLPYRVNHYTRYINPLKLYEYLAGGRPLVGTRIPSLEEFPDVVAMAGTPEEWTAAIRRSLEAEARSPRQREARQRVAREHDWDAIVYGIALDLAELVDPRARERLEADGGEGGLAGSGFYSPFAGHETSGGHARR